MNQVQLYIESVWAAQNTVYKQYLLTFFLTFLLTQPMPGPLYWVQTDNFHATMTATAPDLSILFYCQSVGSGLVRIFSICWFSCRQICVTSKQFPNMYKYLPLPFYINTSILFIFISVSPYCKVYVCLFTLIAFCQTAESNWLADHFSLQGSLQMNKHW